MTPDQAAALIWAAGTAVIAVHLFRGYLRFLGADPLTLCDRCRHQRRRGNDLLDRLHAVGVALAFVLAAARWPVMAPAWGVRTALGKRHRCDRRNQRADA